MKMPTGARKFLIGVMGLVVLAAVTLWFSPWIPRTKNAVVVLPGDYYQLLVDRSGSVYCTDPKTKSWQRGDATVFAHPSRDNPTDVILVLTNAGLKKEDLERPIKTEEDAQRLVTVLNSLRPYAIFHFHYMEETRIILDVYTRKESSNWNALKFWAPQFEKEWELLDTQIYGDDGDGDDVGGSMLKKVYGMDCHLVI